jgi:hypothetical protein
MRFGLRFKGLSLPFTRLPVFNRLSRLLDSFSVRTRVIVLALIPVVGFLANGLTYGARAKALSTTRSRPSNKHARLPMAAAISRLLSGPCGSR